MLMNMTNNMLINILIQNLYLERTKFFASLTINSMTTVRDEH
jgi:hypothetical protein